MSSSSPPTTPPRLFCFGFGYSCDYLAGSLLKSGEGWKIAGTTRSPEKKQSMAAHGVDAYIFDHDKPLGDPRHFLKGVTHVLISAPPDDEGDPVFNLHAEAILEIPTIEWVGYLSSSSVYGDRDGAWVDETAVPNPASQRGSRRYKAEQQWLSLFKYHGLPVHVFRISGIYGPHRSVIDSLRFGVNKRIEKPGHVFNRVHVADIAQVLRASMREPNPGRIYNVSDDVPAPSHELIAYACDIMGEPLPPLVPFAQANLPPMARSFYSENKRLRNQRIKDELGVHLLYPDFKKGLDACLRAEDEELFLLQGGGAGRTSE